MQTKMSSYYGSGYGYGYGKGSYGKGGGQDWSGGRRSRSGGRGPSAWPPRQSPPGMGSAKTHRRSAQRSRSQARDREDAAKWRQHVAAMPPTPPSPTLTPAPTTSRPPTPPSPPPPSNDRLVQFPSPGSPLITITNEAAPLDAAPDPPTPDAAPAPLTPGAHDDFVMCDLCGGAGWLPGYVARRDWVPKA